MRKILFSAMLAVCGAMMFTSCSNDEAVGADKIGEYQANFEKVFGQVSPYQNFNTQKTVTIESYVTNASGNYTLKVYDGKPGKKGASLLGKFENLNAGAVSTVKVDVSKGAKALFCVADDGTSRRLTTSTVTASGRVTAKFDATTGTTGETEVTEEPASVTIAFEDLGSEDDFDFNDAVIKVDYVTGTGVANITLMAVGAVLPLKLYYADVTGQTSPLFDGQELHEVMGRSQKTIINTNWKTKNSIAGADNVEFVTTEIEVPEDFTIGEDGAPFILEVNGVEGQRQITASTEYGAIPQVLVVGKFHSDDEAKTFFFRWPKERVRLDAAFPGISGWMNDPTDLSFLGDGVENNLYNGYDPTIEDEQPTTNTPEGLEAVDLGLPSGTLWANMNVGATAPEESGGYYAWGETEEKDYYDISTYIHCDGSWDTCHDLGTDIAGTEYDVAHVKWGGDWQMPTSDQIQELLNYTTSTWTTQNGVNGRLFTASNGKSIFLPAAGVRYEDRLIDSGSDYWSSSQNPLTSYGAFALYIQRSGEIGFGWELRPCGQSVRPVISPQKEETTTPAVLEAIDLGLPSGTKWANMNVGATTPEEYGSYFAWGETEEKDYYDWSTYIHCDGSLNTCHDIGADIAGTEYDAATANMGPDWQMPTKDQIDELLNNTIITMTTQNGVIGTKFTGTNGNSIFLPTAGYRLYSSLNYAGNDGDFWSSTEDPDYSGSAFFLYVNPGRAQLARYNGVFGLTRCYGMTVRPVLRN